MPGIVLAAILGGCVLPGFADAQEPDADREATPDTALSAQEITERIQELRTHGRYADAIPLAERLTAILAADSLTAAHERTDAGRLLATLRHVASLPDPAVAALAAADSLEGPILDCYREKRLAEAAAMIETALAARSRWLGYEHHELAGTLYLLALVELARDDAGAAEPLLREALAIQRRTLGDRHPDVVHSLLRLASLHFRREEYEPAIALWEEALDLGRSVLGESDGNVIATLNNLGQAQKLAGRPDEAERLRREALALGRRKWGDRHAYVAILLRSLADSQRDLGDLDGAEASYREALDIHTSDGDEESAGYLRSLNGLALVALERGDLGAAEALFRRVLELGRRQHGGDHPEVALCLNNLAQVRLHQGDLATARDLLEEALAIQRAMLPATSLGTAATLDRHATVLRAMGDREEAERMYREALRMREEVLGAEHPLVAQSLNNLALLLCEMERFEDAETLFRRSLAIRRGLLGEEHALVATGLCNLALLESSRGEPRRALPLFREGLDLRRRLQGAEHPLVCKTLSQMAAAHHDAGDLAGAERCLREAAGIYDLARLRAGTGLERATLELPNPYPVLALTLLERGREEEAWPLVEKAQARTLAEFVRAARERRLTAAEASRQKELQRRLTGLEAALAASDGVPGGAGEVGDERRRRLRADLLAAEAEWSTFQREIQARHPLDVAEALSLEEIQAHLAPGTAIVGWCEGAPGSGDPVRWAYAIRREGPVRWTRLPADDAGVTDHATRRLRRALGDPYSDAGDLMRLANAVWTAHFAPLEARLDGVARLVVIPSGELLGLPVEALVDGTGRYLAERFVISYAPSATLHARLHGAGDARRGRPDAVLLLGDPPYSPDHLAAMEAAGQTPAAPGAAPGTPPAESALRSARAGDAAALAALPRLAHSRGEIEAIAALFPGAEVRLGAQASEQELVRLAEGGELARFGTIHLATHALVDDERPERSALVLCRTGLPDPLRAALAGERVYDGLLTAQEIAGEWRLAADLVVLSACETALGREVAGEGYIGFAHAFFQAGARNLLVSLWPVDDRATTLLMQRFYENVSGEYAGSRDGATGTPMPRERALREAKAFLRGYRDGTGRAFHAHPFYWSSFVLLGGGG